MVIKKAPLPCDIKELGVGGMNGDGGMQSWEAPA